MVGDRVDEGPWAPPRLADLQRFFGEFYTPNNAALCLAGDFNPELSPRSDLPLLHADPPWPGDPRRSSPCTPLVQGRGDLKETDKVTQPRVYWAWPTVMPTITPTPPRSTCSRRS